MHQPRLRFSRTGSFSVSQEPRSAADANTRLRQPRRDSCRSKGWSRRSCWLSAEKLPLIAGVWPPAIGRRGRSAAMRKAWKGRRNPLTAPKVPSYCQTSPAPPTHLPDTHRRSASRRRPRDTSHEVPAASAPRGTDRSTRDHIYQNYPERYSYGCSCLQRQLPVYSHKCTHNHLWIKEASKLPVAASKIRREFHNGIRKILNSCA